MENWQPSITGLDIGDTETTPTAGRSAIANAAVATVRALDQQGLLRNEHALTVQLVLELAAAIGRGLSYGKVTVAVSQLTRQLLDALEQLPKPAGADDSLGAAWRDFQAAIAGTE